GPRRGRTRPLPRCGPADRRGARARRDRAVRPRRPAGRRRRGRAAGPGRRRHGPGRAARLRRRGGGARAHPGRDVLVRGRSFRGDPVILPWLASLAWASITIEDPPRPGEETVVVVTDDAGRPRAGETVRVIHRPGLGGEREVAVGITDARGRVRWTPQMDGVTIVRAGE